MIFEHPRVESFPPVVPRSSRGSGAEAEAEGRSREERRGAVCVTADRRRFSSYPRPFLTYSMKRTMKRSSAYLAYLRGIGRVCTLYILRTVIEWNEASVEGVGENTTERRTTRYDRLPATRTGREIR